MARRRGQSNSVGRFTAATSLALLAIGITACARNGDDAPGAAPSGTGDETVISIPHGVRPVGFERVAATITAADGTVCDVCLWLADTSDQRSRGLMGVTDVGNSDGTADGMAFVYQQPHTGAFWMKNTLLPLSIAFFAESGAYLSSFDMEPCIVEPCQKYPTAPEFTVAIEVPQGNLPALSIAEGSNLLLTDRPCGE